MTICHFFSSNLGQGEVKKAVWILVYFLNPCDYCVSAVYLKF